MKLKSCKNHLESIYTLKNLCPICAQPTSSAHYKFIKIRPAKEKAKENQNSENER